ncbi:hypothetical protein hmeg3_09545 [Herbaspirillum sp. meg3]|uniref:methyl-accepting chemotaxis protein n=1 Tax=Herbaspirillum sp. meg3 TaxID=2025949 RepID=UPI000B97E4DC|nr:methyl-accepting chemotaxis protein [Herbaspirillum sp. meg3]ASU38515.1 hypothetical protein hmeg3_09545 [Herbaspirillum sp. meg3]
MRKINNMKIGNRLRWGFAIILVISGLMTALAVWNLQMVANRMSAMMERPLSKERLSSDWFRYIETGITRTTAIAKSSDTTLAAFLMAGPMKPSAEVQEKIKTLLDTEEEHALFKNIGVQRDHYLETRDRLSQLKSSGQMEAAAAVLEKEYLPASRQFAQSVQQLLDMQRNQIDAIKLSIEETAQKSRRLLILLECVAIALGLLCAQMLTRSIVLPLQSAVAIARRVAGGDLSADIIPGRKDETGQLLEALSFMNTSLRDVVGKVRSSISNIAIASGEIATGNMDLSSRTEQQAASLEETASAMEELTSTVRLNADNADEAKDTATAAAAIADKGGLMVARVVDTMNEISESSRQIANIIGVIDGIAFQTNILALNAAVEAARAGEQGRGFAVVASEVRSLAQRSANAAKEIKELIGVSVSRVEAGTQLVDDAGATMHEIVVNVGRVAQIIADISVSSKEQASGIEQVGHAIALMDGVTQKNAALVEEAAAAAAAMKEEARSLAHTVEVFKLDGMAAPATSIAALPLPLMGRMRTL